MKLVKILPLVTLVLAGCASRYDQALKGSQAVPFDQQPSVYAAYLKKGDITQSDYNRWMKDWEEAKDEKAALAAMTPKERAEYRLKKESLELQRQQVDAAYAQADATSTATLIGAMNQANANNATRAAATQVSTAINAQ